MQGYNEVMKKRTLEKTIRKADRTFPSVVITGPRQSGKTTLLKGIFSKSHDFVTLEDPDVRIRAKDDPRGFLAHHAPPVILDEVQYVPELLSYIKTAIDEDRSPGQWLLTGSQNFSLMQNVSQSLAGRTAVLSLLPFSYGERIDRGDKLLSVKDWLTFLKRKNVAKRPNGKHSVDISTLILRGNYPEIASNARVDRMLWCASYISTYLERDVRNLAHIGDLTQFEIFLKLCAMRTGQLLNLSSMARDIGISVTTAKKWLSILEAGYIIHLLYPYYKNIGKRLVKTPKLYFCDTALATYFLGLHEKGTLLNSPHFGSLFETYIINDVLKRFLHFGDLPSMYYLRTRDDLEIDLIIELGGKIHLFEIKSTMTVTPKHITSLKKMKDELGDLVAGAYLIANTSRREYIGAGIQSLPFAEVLSI